MHRKKPFSGKAKKVQMQQKRTKKRDDNWNWDDAEDDSLSGQRTRSRSKSTTGGRVSSAAREDPANLPSGTYPEGDAVIDDEDSSTQERIAAAAYGEGELESVFAKLPPGVIEQRKKESMKPLERLPPTAVEVSFEDMYAADAVIDIPKRPKWSYGETKEVLEAREETYFGDWLAGVYAKYPSDGLSYFEHNLEVWRQLWRVAEISDIVLFIVDARHPVLHFPPSLYDYIIKDLQRKLILVFNKIDLIGQETLDAWHLYFSSQFPALHIASFSCYPKDGFLQTDSATAVLKSRVRRQYKRYFRAVGVLDVLRACRAVSLVKSGVTVNWDALIERAEAERKAREVEDSLKEAEERKGRKQRRRGRREEDDILEGEVTCSEEESDVEAEERSVERLHIDEYDVEPSKDWVTIGLVGHPNVGKSSLINSIMGRKVVSTSRTPGHTKHFQTIHLTADVRLCDCPGLVFPAVIAKPLQILSGMYRISQVQEPYTSIAYLAERVPLEEILSLHHPDQDENPESFEWSAWAICEAFALQRGFLTARASRPDVYRAANMILRMCVDGRILLVFKPKGFAKGLWGKVLDNREDLSTGGSELQSSEDEEESDKDEEDLRQDAGAFDLLSGLED